jgi:hypothetical protein
MPATERYPLGRQCEPTPISAMPAMIARRHNAPVPLLPLLVAWLPLLAVVVITLAVTSGTPSGGSMLDPRAARTIGRAALIGGLLCLLGVVLGLRIVMRRSAGRIRGAWPFLVAAPAGVILVVTWALFFQG